MLESNPNLTVCELMRVVGNIPYSESFATVPPSTVINYSRNTCLPNVDEDSRVEVFRGDGSTYHEELLNSSPDFDPSIGVWIPSSGPTETRGILRILSARDFASARKVCQIDCSVEVTLTEEGKELWNSITWRNQHSFLAFFLDGSPVREKDGATAVQAINAIDDDGVLTIGSRLSTSDAQALAERINSGQLR